MISSKSKGLSDEKFAPWVRRESIRAVKLSAGLLAIGLILAWVLSSLSPAVAEGWSSFNYRLSKVALDQHPLALARGFSSRLIDSEYGWKPISFTAPFNVTAARKELRREYPEVATVVDGVPQVPREAALKKADPVKYEQRLKVYLARFQKIESGRFTKLYDRDDMFSPPNANVKLGLFATKFFGLPDSIFHTIGLVFSGGLPGIILFLTVLALSAAPIWRSRRPARTWLKVLVWPVLASALIWGAIVFMALAAAIFGGLTPDTSAVALLVSLPFLSLLAKLPLHLAETLVNRVATRAPWDGIDRRKPRPPSTTTVPPMGGA
jgi:hypothetical protein